MGDLSEILKPQKTPTFFTVDRKTQHKVHTSFDFKESFKH
jgi:hypothetical protein